MPSPDHSNIKLRLSVGFALIIAILATLAVVSVAGFAALGKAASELYDHPLQVSNASLRASMGVIKMHRSMKDIAFFSTTETVQGAEQVVAAEEFAVYRNLDLVRDQILGEEGAALERESRQLFIDWKSIREEVIRLVHVGDRSAAAEITRGKGATH
ncbi:MAG TPA: MCP four helix bundle domain-containing protein, partial [Deferrisomatales bacterium]|nr:MCP four helix bundle domain-containing protein [Deferrisomatales bacterium]